MRRFSTGWVILLLCGIGVVLPPSTNAVERTWDGGHVGGGSNGDNWSNANNWDNNALPENDADVVFGTAFTSGTSIDLIAARTVNSFTINTITAFSIDGGDNLTLTSGLFTRNDVTGTELNHTVNAAIILGTNGVFTINGSGTLTISGVIQDGGSTFSFTKSGAGVLVLTGGANTYNGDTIINGGILRLGVADKIGNGAGFGNLVVNSGGTFDLASFSDTINGLSGSGTVDRTSGTGTLTVGGGNASATFSGTITDTSGTLNLVKTGTGTQTLSGTNSYAGTTTITAGVMRIDGANSLGAANLDLNGGVIGLGAGNFTRSLGTAAGQVQWSDASGGFAAYGADRTVNIGGAGATLSTSTSTFFGNNSADALILGAADATHTVTFVNGINFNTGSNDRTIQVDNGAAATDAIISGVIEGSSTGWIKAGLGTLELTAANTYSGNTLVVAGKLLVNNTAPLSSGTGTGAVTVSTNGTLGGNGAIAGGVTINTTGTLSPGESIGSLDVAVTTGALTFNTGSTFAYEINTTLDSADLLNVNDNVTISTTGLGVTLSLDDLAPMSVSAGTKFTLISYSGTLTGNFSGLANGATVNLDGNTYAINYDDPMGPGSNGGSYGNYVTLTAVPEPAAILFGGVVCTLVGIRLGGRRLVAKLRRQS